MSTADHHCQFLSIGLAIITVVGFAGIAVAPAAATEDPSITDDDDVIVISEGDDDELLCVNSSFVNECVDEDDSPLVKAIIQESEFAKDYALGATDRQTKAIGKELAATCVTVNGDKTCGDEIVPQLYCGSFGVVDVSRSCNDATDSSVNNL